MDNLLKVGLSSGINGLITTAVATVIAVFLMNSTVKNVISNTKLMWTFFLTGASMVLLGYAYEQLM
jgi:predicted phage tail protein